ncbi:SA1362 family protein [Sutcliffiella halmapala]|uniref:SA1362 family protein n=1 Tax=Sutcliffiella halmapala TaxID=79882 RepID=UPI000995DABA|nr:SA1362 family protein [Sutcliffiella halmapala]
MKRNFGKPILIILLSLAGFYFGIRLFSDPKGLFTTLLLIVGGATVFYLVFRHFIQGRLGGKTDARYSKAVKQSKKKYPTAKPKPNVSPLIGKDKQGLKSNVQKRKSSSHLTVIEGKKGKKKNRAFF